MVINRKEEEKEAQKQNACDSNMNTFHFPILLENSATETAQNHEETK